MLDVLADRPHLLEGGRDIELGSGQGPAQEAHVERAAAQVEGGHHGPSLKGRRQAALRASQGAALRRAERWDGTQLSASSSTAVSHAHWRHVS